jgi:hypothetical protein
VKGEKDAPTPAETSSVPQTPTDPEPPAPDGLKRQDSTTPGSDPSLAYLSQLKYKEGQFRPDFPSGKRVYDDVEFLLTLRECPLAMTYPKHLIKTTASSELSIWKQTPAGRSKLSYGGGGGGGGGGGQHGGGGMMGGGPADFFTPSFVRGSGPGGGGGGGGPGGGGGGMNMRDGRMVSQLCDSSRKSHRSVRRRDGKSQWSNLCLL